MTATLTLNQPPFRAAQGALELPAAPVAFKVEGETMRPRFRPGEFAMVDPGLAPEVGDDVVVYCLDGRRLLKRLNWARGDELQFVAVDHRQPPLTVTKGDIAGFQVVARRVGAAAFKARSRPTSVHAVVDC